MSAESVLLRLEQRGHATSRLRLRPSKGSTPAEAPSEPMKSIGRYEILGELGRGGVGVVMRGMDVDLGREVAVKMLHARHLTAAELLKRFVEEAQIGGQLQHPGIVPVYELGMQASKRPYLTMKLVEGRSLAEILEARADVADGQARVLTVFLQVCRAMAYSHSRKVIHRDLKPANVMVGEFGEVQIVDWGFAKVLDPERTASTDSAAESRRTVITTIRGAGDESAVGAVMGTPAYMPPEQAIGRVDELDERADVFALGAILCEILTGSPPYAEEGVDPLLQAARGEVEPALKRLDACKAERELLSLARRCLEPHRDDRPTDAGHVAREIEAHLAATEERAHRSRLQAIEERAAAGKARARADEARAAAREQQRRRRQGVGLAAAVCLALIVAGGGWLWWQRDRAERRARTAQVVDAALEEAARLEGQGDLAGALGAVRRAHDLAVNDEPSSDVKKRARALLDRLITLERRRREEEQREARDAALLARLEAIRIESGDDRRVDPARIVAALREAELELADASETGREIRTRSRPDEITGALDEWAHLSASVGQRRSLTAIACAADPDGDEVLRSVLLDGSGQELNQYAGKADLSKLSAREIDRLALHLDASGNTEAAAATLRKGLLLHPHDLWISVHLARAHLRTDPPRHREAVAALVVATALRPDSACLWHQLGLAYLACDDDEAALAACREAVRREPRHSDHFLVLARVLELKDLPEEALANFREAVSLDPGSANAQHGLGLALQARDSPEEACTALREAVRIDPSRSDSHLALGNARLQRGDVAGAVIALTEAVRLDPENATAHNNLAVAHLRAGADEDAAGELERARALDPASQAARYNLALARHRLGDLEDAVARLRSHLARPGGWRKRHSYLDAVLLDENSFDGAVEVFRAAVDAAPDSLDARIDLGEALYHGDDAEAALALYEGVLALHPDDARSHVGRGMALYALERKEEALVALLRAVELEPDAADARQRLGYTLSGLGRRAEGVAQLRRAVAIEPGHATAHQNLAAALGWVGRFKEAAAHARRSIELAPNAFNAHNILGSVLMNGRDPRDVPEAFDAFRKGIRLRKGDQYLHMNLGSALSALHDLPRTKEQYRRALDLGRDEPHLYFNYGAMLCNDFGDSTGALEVFQAGLEIDPENHLLLSNLGVTLRTLGRVDDALAAFRKALEVEPEYPHARFELGVTLLHRLGKPAEALPHLLRATRRTPRAKGRLKTCASVLVALGRWNEALALLREGIAAIGNHPARWDAMERLAHYLAHQPGASPEQLEEALSVINTVRRGARGGGIDQTRGEVLYLMGRYRAARQIIEPLANRHIDGGGFATRAYLALIHKQLGLLPTARAWYEKAEERSDRVDDTDPVARAVLEELRAAFADGE